MAEIRLTTWDVWNPVDKGIGIFTIWTGAGFLPSTVWLQVLHLEGCNFPIEVVSLLENIIEKSWLSNRRLKIPFSTLEIYTYLHQDQCWFWAQFDVGLATIKRHSTRGDIWASFPFSEWICFNQNQSVPWYDANDVRCKWHGHMVSRISWNSQIAGPTK